MYHTYDLVIVDRDGKTSHISGSGDTLGATMEGINQQVQNAVDGDNMNPVTITSTIVCRRTPRA